MQNYRRALTPGGTFFFTVNTYNRQPVLTKPDFYRALKDSIRSVMKIYPFQIEAFVLLPDHLHCIWRLPENDFDYSKRWSIIKRKTGQEVKNKLNLNLSQSMTKRKETGLWQRRFWEHQIRDEEDFATHVNYIHWNPVKHGYVKSVVEWPYSSFHKFVKAGVCSEDWGGIAEPDGVCFGETT